MTISLTRKREIADALEKVADYAANHWIGNVGPQAMRVRARELRREVARETAQPMSKLLPSATGAGTAASLFGPDGNGDYWQLTQSQLCSGDERGAATVQLHLSKAQL